MVHLIQGETSRAVLRLLHRPSDVTYALLPCSGGSDDKHLKPSMGSCSRTETFLALHTLCVHLGACAWGKVHDIQNVYKNQSSCLARFRLGLGSIFISGCACHTCSRLAVHLSVYGADIAICTLIAKVVTLLIAAQFC